MNYLHLFLLKKQKNVLKNKKCLLIKLVWFNEKVKRFIETFEPVFQQMTTIH